MSRLGWAGYALSAWLAALWLSWLLLAKADFFYPLWYRVLDIPRTVAIYGPQNRHRAHFHLTTKSERLRLFRQLVVAIHDGGRGLETLTYRDVNGQELDRFLTAPEVLHLQDVARLIDTGTLIGWSALAVWLAATLVLRRRRVALPRLGQLFIALLLPLLGAGLVILVLGPTAVFYWLHAQLFPPDHPWFFYYQDSLMTTLLQAPTIFGPIGLSWVGLALGVYIAMLSAARFRLS